jgi:hypothetical protein
MALGHNSKAILSAYAKRAQVILPPLEEYEQKIVPLANLNKPAAVATVKLAQV